jgi:hypothetical protein
MLPGSVMLVGAQSRIQVGELRLVADPTPEGAAVIDRIQRTQIPGVIGVVGMPWRAATQPETEKCSLIARRPCSNLSPKPQVVALDQRMPEITSGATCARSSAYVYCSLGHGLRLEIH